MDMPSYRWCHGTLCDLSQKYEHLANSGKVQPALAEAVLNSFKSKLVTHLSDVMSPASSISSEDADVPLLDTDDLDDGEFDSFSTADEKNDDSEGIDNEKRSDNEETDANTGPVPCIDSKHQQEEPIEGCWSPSDLTISSYQDQCEEDTEKGSCDTLVSSESDVDYNTDSYPLCSADFTMSSLSDAAHIDDALLRYFNIFDSSNIFVADYSLDTTETNHLSPMVGNHTYESNADSSTVESLSSSPAEMPACIVSNENESPVKEKTSESGVDKENEQSKANDDVQISKEKEGLGLKPKGSTRSKKRAYQEVEDEDDYDSLDLGSQSSAEEWDYENCIGEHFNNKNAKISEEDAEVAALPKCKRIRQNEAGDRALTPSPLLAKNSPPCK
ncbi:hypothetical protein H4219_001370 [Mycoemilia scoparia]|uniref:Uncharacterized protein n=1 Tax=Mycoemilia scoparia TaxID=417184 RepID=A0A9W8DVV3_9FUNG|nr:hypothetical protein H4219_001370 [Mycoemilia scoparia]